MDQKDRGSAMVSAATTNFDDSSKDQTAREMLELQAQGKSARPEQLG